MQEAFTQAKILIEASDSVLLTMHERMDGDDGGSVLAMAKVLKSQGKNVSCAIKKGVPENLRFLTGASHIQDDIEEGRSFDLLITFGCNSLKRTGSERIAGLDTPIINFDHHPDNELFGQINIVDQDKSSVAELVYDFFVWAGWTITKDIAICLLTGIITDTGSFMHSNTKASTLKAAAELMKKGALTNKIIKHTYGSKHPRTLQAWGRAMENSYYDRANRIVYSVFTDKDLEETGLLPQSAFEGFVETLNAVPEARFAMFLRQDGEIIKGSLRSDPYKQVDVSQIARLLGGGGHKLAAGFSVAGKLVKDEYGKWKVV